VKNRVIIAAAILAGVFLVGFIPQYVKANRLDTELRQARQANVAAELRDLIGLAYVQATRRTTVLRRQHPRGSSTGCGRWRTRRQTRISGRSWRIFSSLATKSWQRWPRAMRAWSAIFRNSSWKPGRPPAAPGNRWRHADLKESRMNRYA